MTPTSLARTGSEVTASLVAAEMSVALGQVSSWWARERFASEQTLARTAEIAARLASRLSAQGYTEFGQEAPEDVADFIYATTGRGQPPVVTTLHARRTAVRALYRGLRAVGYPVGDPTIDLVLPSRGVRAARPLTEDEVALCRASARLGQAGSASLRRAAAWALGEAGAVSSEISAARLVDVDDPASPRTVWLSGTRRTDPRTAVLTGWGSRILARWCAGLPDDDPDRLLVYNGAAPPGRAVAQASVCNALREVLVLAGMGRESDVRPASLRGWVGRTGYEAGVPLNQVALMLGLRSLDATADVIALDWHPGPGALGGKS